MKKQPLIGERLIELYDNHIKGLNYIGDMNSTNHELSRTEFIRQIKYLWPEHKTILTTSMGLTTEQINAIYQIYCSDLIKQHIYKGEITSPFIISANIRIDISKKWGVINYDRDKYTLTDKVACRDCKGENSCVEHSNLYWTSKELLAQDLELEVCELEEALIVAGE